MIDFPGAVVMDRAGTSDQREDIVRGADIVFL